ncbi:PorV/PorQ family protein [bacterium]|nr:PorV/PorQ family protein [bacterium]
MMIKRLFFIVLLAMVMMAGQSFGDDLSRHGTTSASFLELGIGGAGVAMGDAYVALADDISSMYWNPAGLAHLKTSEMFFMAQPYIANIKSLYAGVGLVLPQLGTIGIGINAMTYGDYNGDMQVTNMDFQDGTGEMYSAYDYSVNVTYARKLVRWFSFGASMKYIISKVWHMQASALALDVGVSVQTPFFSPTGREEDGLRIGMSISNYGSSLSYDGVDLMFPVDQDPDHDGEYQNAQGKYVTRGWELPLIFRVGIAVDAIKTSRHCLTLALDALHPNNNTESLNAGAQYKLSLPGYGQCMLRGGYKGIFLADNQYGPTFGGGIVWWVAPGKALKIDYAYHSIGPLGHVHCTSLGLAF